MIKIVKLEKQDLFDKGISRLFFSLKASRNIWLAEEKLKLEYPSVFVNLKNLGEAAVYSLLPIAFVEHSDMELPPSLSIEPETQNRVEKICELWNKWFNCNRKIKIFANIAYHAPVFSERNGAQLFSGGVDSLSTFQRNKGKIRFLLFFKGSDISTARIERLREVERNLNEFAQEQGKTLVTLSTNARFLGTASWEYLTHGCAMVGPALALSNYIDRIYVGATFSGEFAKKFPWGSHPDLDPKIRTRDVETFHEGFELERPLKIVLLAGEPRFLKRLRVCTKDNITGLNCGCCEKCYRTSSILAMLGISAKDSSFPEESFSLLRMSEFIQNCKFREDLNISWSKNLKFIESTPVDIEGKKELITVLRKRLSGYYKNYLKGFPSGTPLDYPLPKIHSVWHCFENALGLKSDALAKIRKFIRLFRGRRYSNFKNSCKHFLCLKDA